MGTWCIFYKPAAALGPTLVRSSAGVVGARHLRRLARSSGTERIAGVRAAA
jgi:hypothetical protein